MKETQIVYNVQTGQQEVIEVELTQAELDEREKQNKVSQINQRLQEIRVELQQGDWRTVRHAELVEQGLDDEGYIEFIANRSLLREEYNELELQLGE